MTDPRFRIPAEAEPLGEQLDKLLDHARDAGISDEGIAVVLEDRAASARRKADEE